MKKITILLFAVLLIVTRVISQTVVNPANAELINKVIGWENMLPPIGNATGPSTTVQGRTYTAFQIGLIDSFTNWIQKSYIPVGGLPQPQRTALPGKTDPPQHLPAGTGVSMLLWKPAYDETGKKITRAQPPSASTISVLTNYIPGMEPASWFNTSTQFYFTMYYDRKGKLVNQEDEKITAPFVNSIKANVGNYLCYFTGKTFNVILIPEKELPLVQITRREVLDKGEEAIRRAYAANKMPQFTEAINNINRLREKYKNSLNEPAFINHVLLSIDSFTGKDQDLFQKKSSDRYMYPVYKIKPTIYELCEKDQPQWVAVSWPYASEKDYKVDWEIFKAMTNNFNFEYIYNYFFNPVKVNGQSYHPRHEIPAGDNR